MNAGALYLLMATGALIVNDQTSLHSLRKVPLCKQFDLVLPRTALRSTRRHEHLLLSPNIKETKEISKAINQSSQAVAQRGADDRAALCCTSGA